MKERKVKNKDDERHFYRSIGMSTKRNLMIIAVIADVVRLPL